MAEKIQAINRTTALQKAKNYLSQPLSLALFLLVSLAALLTVAVLLSSSPTFCKGRAISHPIAVRTDL
jgi:hypothetical protein